MEAEVAATVAAVAAVAKWVGVRAEGLEKVEAMDTLLVEFQHMTQGKRAAIR